MDEVPGFKDYRVLYQYNNENKTAELPDKELKLRTNFGPTFSFVTVLARSPEEAAEQVTAVHEAYDQNFSVVQVFEANDFETGFSE